MQIDSALKNVTGIIAFVAAISYICGFIIVNSHLLSFGFLDASLIRARYISAGLLFVVFLGICLFLFIGDWYKLFIELNYNKYSIKLLVIVIVLIVLIVVIITILTGLALFLANTDYIKSIAYSVISGDIPLLEVLAKVSAWVFVSSVTATTIVVLKYDVEMRFKSKARVPMVMFIAINLFLLVNVYSRTLYPYLLPSLGGGKHIYSTLQYDNADIVKNIFGVEGRTSIDVQIIDQNYFSFFVVSKSTPIQIRKSDVLSISPKP